MIIKFNNVSILHTAYIDAPVQVSSSEIEHQLDVVFKKLKIPNGTIFKLTGVDKRRYWHHGYKPSIQATLAANKVIQESGIDKSRIGILINCSVCKDFIEPSVASMIHGNAALSPTCINYDVSSACIGLFNSIQIIGNMLERKQIEYGLIVASEGSRFVIDQTINRLNKIDVDLDTFWKNFPTLTLGSGSFAMILTTMDKNNKRQIRGSTNLGNTSHHNLCVGQRNFMHTNGRQIQEYGIELVERSFKVAHDAFEFAEKPPVHIIPHQISKRSILRGIKQLDLCPSRVHTIFKDFGNIGPALVPITLGKLFQQNVVKNNERIVLIGAGSGLNAGIIVID